MTEPSTCISVLQKQIFTLQVYLLLSYTHNYTECVLGWNVSHHTAGLRLDAFGVNRFKKFETMNICLVIFTLCDRSNVKKKPKPEAKRHRMSQEGTDTPSLRDESPENCFQGAQVTGSKFSFSPKYFLPAPGWQTLPLHLWCCLAALGQQGCFFSSQE